MGFRTRLGRFMQHQEVGADRDHGHAHQASVIGFAKGPFFLTLYIILLRVCVWPSSIHFGAISFRIRNRAGPRRR